MHEGGAPMTWMDGMSAAVAFMESHLDETIAPEEIAAQAGVSPFHFQRAFSLLCGVTVGEYLRRRRLTLAGGELVSGDARVIDLAVKYGYDSADSFTRAFTRFHGATPTDVRKNGALLRAYAPLKIKLSLEGGFMMEYQIQEKAAFTVLGAAKRFDGDTCLTEIPKFWAAHYAAGRGKLVCGMYGICMEADGNRTFEYLIADDYRPGAAVPEGFVVRKIPAHTWAVFPCRGPMPAALQDVNRKIYAEWLPGSRDWELDGGCDVELYTDAAQYPQGTQDKNYYTEIWIPVKRKA
jgi:AraC family transcriptional regulator